MSRHRHGRRKPYTNGEIKKLKCVRCGRRARFQWAACADANLWRPMCKACDVLLNLLVLGFMGDPDAGAKIVRYEKAMATR